MATSSPPESQQYVDFDEYVDFQLQKIRKQVRTNDILFASVSLMSSLILYLLGFTLFDQWIVPGGFSYGLRVTLLLLFVVSMSAWLWVRIWRPYRKQVNALYAAQVIENAVPSLKSRLMTLIDFRSTNRQPDPSIVKAIEKQTAVRLAKADLEEAVNHQPLLRASYFFLGVLFLFFIYMMLSPKDILPSIWRALLPPAEVAVATETTIESVKPGNTTVYEFSELDVSVELSGRVPEQVTLYYSTLDETYVDEPVKLRKTEDVLPTFQGRILGENGEGIRQAFNYYIVAGDIRSEEYQVKVIAPPEITFESISTTYPKYMQLPVKKQSVGHLDEWEGSLVRLTAHSNVEIKTAEVIFSDDESFETKAERQNLKISDGKTITGEWKLRLRTDGTYPRFYRLQCQTAEGEKNRNAVTYRYRIRPDEAPVIQLIDPTEDIERPANAVVPLMFKAEDPDFRLSSVRIFVEKNGEQIYRQTILDSPRKKVEGIYQLPLKKLALRPGEVISYWFEAEDNKQPEHNKKKSGSLKITVTDRVKQREADKQLKEDKQRQRELHEQLEEQEKQQENNEPQNQDNADPDEKKQNPEQSEEQKEQEQNKGSESSSEEQSSGGESSEAQSAEGNKGSEESKQEDQANEDQESKSEEISDESSSEGTGQSEESSAEGTDPSEQSEPSADGEQNSDQEQPLDPTSQEDQAEALQKINDYLKEQQQKQEESQQQKQDSQNVNDPSKENPDKQQPQENAQGENKPDNKQEQGESQQEEQEKAENSGASEQPKPESESEENKSGAGESNEKQEAPQQKNSEEKKQEGSEGQESAEEQKQNQPGSKQEQNSPSSKNEEQQSESEEQNDSQNSSSSQQEKSESKPGKEGEKQNSELEESDANAQGNAPKGGDPQEKKNQEQKSETQDPDKKQEEDKSSDKNQTPSEKKPSTEPQKPKSDDGNNEEQPKGEGKQQQPKEGQAKKPANEKKENANEDPMKSEKEEGTPQKKQDAEKKQGATQKKDPEQQEATKPKEEPQASKEDNKQQPDQQNPNKSEDKPKGEQQKMKDSSSKQEKSDEPPPKDGVPKENPDPNAKKMEGKGTGKSEEDPQGQKEGKSTGEKTDKAPPEKKNDPSKKKAEGGEKDSSQPPESPDAQPQKKGSKPSAASPKGGEAPKGQGSGSEGSGEPSSIEEAEKANEEYAKQAAELILKKLDKQIKRGEIDDDLLEKLGWNEKQLKSFSESLKKQLSQPEVEDKRSKANQSQFLEMLKSLNLKNTKRSLKGDKIQKFDQTGLGSQRTPVPDQYKELLEEFNRSQSRRTNSNRK